MTTGRRSLAALSSLVLTGGVLAGVAPAVQAVDPGQPVLVGSLQDELGCAEDWAPACDDTALAATAEAGVYEATFTVPAGQYEAKIAIGGSWEESYGLDGGDANIPLSLAGATELTFRFDEATSRLSIALPGQPTDYTEADADLAAAPYRHAGGGETFYFVLTDRFANGDPSNDTGGIEGDRYDHGFDPTDKGFYQGGDIAGLHSKLDYIEGLGMSAIWLTPSFKNNPVQGEGEDASAGYHGYWVTDFTQLDPHLGTNEEFKAFIDDAHSRGIKVYFDIITNHTADLIDYEEGEYSYIDQATAPYLDADGNPFDPTAVAQSPDFPTLDPATSFPYTPVRSEENTVMVPEVLNDVTMYHNRGNSTWQGESVTFGDFDGLDDLMTEDPRVLATMEDIYTTWMDFGIDGFRIDTVKHVDFGFWEHFTRTLVEHQAATPAGDQFFTFGEVYDADATKLSPYVRDTDMSSVLDFAYQSSATNWARGYSAQGLSGLFDADDYYTTATSSAADLPTFLGNHDMGRIGNLLAGGDRLAERSALAHTTMLLTRGQPVVYYGDEQGFVGDGHDKDARQSMFPSQVDSYLDDTLIDGSPYGPGEHFDTSAQLYPLISELATLRHDTPALNQGAQIELYAEQGAGVYAVARVDREEKVEHLVALNNASEERTVTFTALTPGAAYTPLYGEHAPVTAGSDGTVTLTVPSLDGIVLVADQRVADAGDDQTITLTPQVGGAVDGIAPITADVADDRWSETSFWWREAGTEEWLPLGTAEDDTPRVFHDVRDLAPGTVVEYRAVNTDADGTRVAASTTAVVGADLSVDGPSDEGGEIGADSVTLPGSHNAAMGCTADWQPDCPSAMLALDEESGLYTGTFDIPAGSYEFKVAIGGSWDENYGTDGVADGPNMAYEHDGGPITFWYDPETHLVLHTAQGPIVTLPGSFNAALGCTEDWKPSCMLTWMTDPDGDGVYTFSTDALPTGSYEVKVAHDGTWDVNYGVGGAADGENYTFSVEAGQTVSFSYDLATHVLTIEVTEGEAGDPGDDEDGSPGPSDGGGDSGDDETPGDDGAPGDDQGGSDGDQGEDQQTGDEGAPGDDQDGSEGDQGTGTGTEGQQTGDQGTGTGTEGQQTGDQGTGTSDQESGSGSGHGSSESGSGLARTGSDVAPWALAGSAVLLGGLVMLAARLRRS